MSGESGNLYSKLRRNPVISAAITQACQLHKPCMHGEKTESSPVTNYKSTTGAEASGASLRPNRIARRKI